MPTRQCSSEEYTRIFDLPDHLGYFFRGFDRDGFWGLLRQTVLGNHSPENVILTEVDPLHQKTLPDFLLTLSSWESRSSISPA